jgi:hypothetical protein
MGAMTMAMIVMAMDAATAMITIGATIDCRSCVVPRRPAMSGPIFFAQRANVTLFVRCRWRYLPLICLLYASARARYWLRERFSTFYAGVEYAGLGKTEAIVKAISIIERQVGAGPRFGRAVILAAPLWASGLVFLAVLFAIAKHGEFFSLQFLAMSVAIVFGSTVAAWRVMDHDLQPVGAPQIAEHRRMKMRARRLHGARLI